MAYLYELAIMRNTLVSLILCGMSPSIELEDLGIWRSEQDCQDYLTAGSPTGLEAVRRVAASLSLAGGSLNEIFGSIGQREWILTTHKNNRMRQQLFQPPSHSPASRARTAHAK